MSEPSLHLSWNALQLQGRRERQEDAWCVRHLPGGDGLLALIADGLGGHPEGDYASRSTVQRVADALEAAAQPVFRLGDPERRAATMRQAFVAAHLALREYAAGRGHAKAGPATTLIAAHLDGDGRCSLAGVGDSLVWHFGRNGLARVLEPQGEGAWVEFSLGSCIEEGRAVQVRELRIEAGDRLILATDGIDTLSDSALREIFGGPPELAMAQLATAIHRAARVLQDNVTVVLIEAQANDR